MLAVAHPRGADHGDGCLEDFGAGGDNFSDAFSGGDLQLEDIDFDDIFVGFDETDDLQDLQVEPLEIFAALSADGSSPEQSVTTSSAEAKSGDAEEATTAIRELEEDGCLMATAAAGDGDEGTCKAPPKASQAKKKVKVDWTPELHRRFVQVVEQLGIDKVVPSKILEIMGIEGLTRHNIASHLQKYRSHRKHLLSREAETATWSQRRRMYGGGGGSGAQGGCGGVAKRVSPTPWLAPTMGFPPPPPMHHFRQLHVWGHPTADHAMMHMWPRQPLVPSRPHLAHWPPPPDPASFWHSPHPPPPPPAHPHYPKGMMHQVIPCLTQPVLPPATRLATKAVRVVPPQQQQQVIYNKQEAAPPPPVVHRLQHLDLLPSNETIDAALGDILSKPWLPLPLGLKPPSTDSVLSELQRQGISRVPPSCA